MDAVGGPPQVADTTSLFSVTFTPSSTTAMRSRPARIHDFSRRASMRKNPGRRWLSYGNTGAPRENAVYGRPL